MKAADITLAKRYARAYMGLDGKGYGHALEEGAKARLQALKKVLSAVEPFRKALLHPVINGTVKKELLGKILGAAAAYAPALAFTEFLVKENRFFLFSEVAREAAALFEAWCGEKKAEVRARYDLGEAEIKRLEKLLAKASGGKVRLEQVLSDRVLGGFEIKMGGLLIDATVKGRLARLKKELFAA